VKLLSLVVLASFGAGTTRGALAQASQPPRSQAAGVEGRIVERTYTAGESSRRYLVYTPSAYDGRRRLPLVVMLHGCTQDAADFARGTRMNVLAESRGVIVAWPEQPQAAHPLKCWNWYEPAHQSRDGGEPALIAGITREAMREFAVDTSRVYLAGISAGGAMALLVAANYPELWTAVAVHSAVEFRAAANAQQALGVMQQGGPSPVEQGDAAFQAMGAQARAIPLIVFHGGADPTVKPVNAEQVFQQWLRTQQRASGHPDTLMTRVDESHGETNGYRWSRALVYDDAEQHVMLERWIVDGLGHKWSGGSPDGTYTDPKGPDAAAEMMRFFLERSR
jgi:poly(hydroxyalkanoate) depolymerase family esterase